MTQPTYSPDTTVFVRFTRGQRLEHLIVMVAFTILALTGLPQKFNQYAISIALINLLGGIETVRLIHRFFAIVLILESVYHVVVVGFKVLTRRARPTMLPIPKDFQDLFQMLRYFLGRTTVKPRFGRYDYRQKVEYWAMVWGTLIMAITGLMMWFPLTVTRFLPGEFIPAAKAAHGGEAVLAVLAILIWHMYSAHLSSPAYFPLDKTIFTGTISRERMIEEHPLEYEMLTGQKLPEDHDIRVMKAEAAEGA